MEMTPGEPQSATDYDDRTTAAVKSAQLRSPVRSLGHIPRRHKARASPEAAYAGPRILSINPFRGHLVLDSRR